MRVSLASVLDHWLLPLPIAIGYCHCPLLLAIAIGYCYCLLLLPIAIAQSQCLHTLAHTFVNGIHIYTTTNRNMERSKLGEWEGKGAWEGAWGGGGRGGRIRSITEKRPIEYGPPPPLKIHWLGDS